MPSRYSVWLLVLGLSPCSSSKQWTAVGYWVGGLWFWYSFWGNTHGHWVEAATSRWTWISYFVSSKSALCIYVPACRTWVCDPCENISPHSMFTWHEAHLILEPTVEENKKYRVHRDHLISKLCSFHDAMLPPKNCERSPLVVLANDSPSVGDTSPVTKRYTSHTKYGTRPVFFQ